jgi:acyl-coenzyme A thioesterase PaaI-like protein
MASTEQIVHFMQQAFPGSTHEIVATGDRTATLRQPVGGKAVLAVCRLLRVGRSTAVGEVALSSEGEDDPVAHATGSYALPRADRRPHQG